MRKLFLFFLFCFFCASHAQTPRNIVVLLDWDTERIAIELDELHLKPGEEGKGFGPLTGTLITALAQKAAPIIVTSSSWHNFVARRKLFTDFLKGRAFTYKNKYKRLNDATIKKFQETIQALFQPNNIKLLDTPLGKELYNYLLCYAIPFQEDEWIIKKASDYIYLLVPKVYLEKLKESKELEKSDELRLKILPEAGNKRNFVTKFSDDELYLGFKIDSKKMPTMSYQDALDPDKHKLSIDKNNYTKLLEPKDMDMIMKYEKRGITVPESFILSKHFINILKNIFVTQQDLTRDKARVDLYRALYLPTWYIYLAGHGVPSDPGTLQDIDFSKADPFAYMQFFYAQLAGMNLFAFREWLAFLQSNIKTEFLFYETCYSGGHHLQKLFEQQWEYSTGTTLKKEVKPDIFNYMIVAGNLAYTATGNTAPYIFPMPEKEIPPHQISINYEINFPQFFKALGKYFSIGHIEVGEKKIYFETVKKLKEEKTKYAAMNFDVVSDADIFEVENEITNLQKKLENLHFITLNGVVDYVHDVEEHRPAVRYPGTDFFIPLSLDEKQQVAERIRFETSVQTQAREAEKIRIEKLIQEQSKKHIEKQKEKPKEPKRPTVSGSENALLKALHALKQKLVQLKNSILRV